jgi:1,4-alpha-glucan branching enzyme
MIEKNSFQQGGLKLVQLVGSAVTLWFDWERLPAIDLKSTCYRVEIIPEYDHLPVLHARPNSAGPLHFHLFEGVAYRLNLIAAPYPVCTVGPDPPPPPLVAVIPQHENLQQLVWSMPDSFPESTDKPSPQWMVFGDGQRLARWPVDADPFVDLRGRPGSIEVRMGENRQWFRVQTNLPAGDIKASLSFRLPDPTPKLFLSQAINPLGGWRLRAEIPWFFGMGSHWYRLMNRWFPDRSPIAAIGAFRLYEDQVLRQEVRQWGYATRIRHDLIDRIQLTEWGWKQTQPVEGFRIELQITSAHRELLKYTLQERHLGPESINRIVGFDVSEIEQARYRLSTIRPHVAWDQSYIELVLFFQVDGVNWQEFQRDIAQSARWDFVPAESTQTCRTEWVLYDLEKPERCEVVLASGTVERPPAAGKVFLRPYSTHQLFAVWDIDRQAVERAVARAWQVPISSVGFYLKVHEEYLGRRLRRADLDCHLIELFSSYQNIYFNVDPDRCFAVEVVARHQQQEIALTAVSSSIVTPKPLETRVLGDERHRSLQTIWFHPSQREVRHLRGHDSGNRAKVLIHLHLHSPNLFRIEPFRDAYLRDVSWPIKTDTGAEVHNPPGEWVMKNCLDAWLPLLRVFRRLAYEGVDYQLSLDISPPVAYQLSSGRFKDYFSRYLSRMQAFTQGRIALMKARRDDPDYIVAAERYLADLIGIDLFYHHELEKDIIGAFAKLEQQGFLELITCTATHGMPAELQSMPDSLDAQLELAARSHHRLFGIRPKGIWLAENSWFPGVSTYLENRSLHYCFVESEAVLCGSPSPTEEEFNPVILPGSQALAFGRSRLGRTQVWDAQLGYAGHPDFREYHYRHRGLPLKRITAKTTDDKKPYHPERAEATARHLACDFHQKLRQLAISLGQRSFRTIPLISCTYDAELFGHHWSEGPVFLEELLRECHRQGDTIGLTTASHYLADRPLLPEVEPNPSTWGHDAVHVRWTDPKVAWTFSVFERAEQVLRRYRDDAAAGRLSDFQCRAVEQMGAELLRAQSSDLTFVIMSGDFEEDMQREILKYLDHFYRLQYLVDNRIDDEEWLTFRHLENGMFPEISDYYRLRRNC